MNSMTLLLHVWGLSWEHMKARGNPPELESSEGSLLSLLTSAPIHGLAMGLRLTHNLAASKYSEVTWWFRVPSVSISENKLETALPFMTQLHKSHSIIPTILNWLRQCHKTYMVGSKCCFTCMLTHTYTLTEIVKFSLPYMQIQH